MHIVIRKRKARRILGLALIVLGGIFLWAAASPVAGSILVAAAVALEAVGFALERRNGGGTAG